MPPKRGVGAAAAKLCSTWRNEASRGVGAVFLLSVFLAAGVAVSAGRVGDASFMISEAAPATSCAGDVGITAVGIGALALKMSDCRRASLIFLRIEERSGAEPEEAF